MSARFLIITAMLAMLSAVAVQAEEINPVVGKAGDFVLREADLERMIAYQPAEVQKRLLDHPEERSSFARQLLLTKAAATKARSEGLDRKPDVKERLSYFIDQYLAEEYMSRLVSALAPPQDEELKKYYKEHEKDFLLPERVKAAHIFFSAPRDDTAEARNRARSKAEEILRRIGKGEDFSQLAREFSDDAETAAAGGNLGYISRGKTNSEEFEKALFALKKGETSAIVESPFGYHIIRVDERQDKRTANFDETSGFIRNRLKGELEQRKAAEILEKLSKEAGLELFTRKSADGGENEKLPAKP